MTQEEKEKYKKEQERKENLVKELYRENGIDPDKMNFPFGDLNVIISIFGKEREGDEYEFEARVYHPRKESITSYNVLDECGGDKEKLAKWLEDSAERFKVLAYLTQRQAKELRELGFIKTTTYYTDANCNRNLVE